MEVKKISIGTSPELWKKKNPPLKVVRVQHTETHYMLCIIKYIGSVCFHRITRCLILRNLSQGYEILTNYLADKAKFDHETISTGNT